MENDIPKIDLPLDMIIGTDISREILSNYTNFPCRLKAEIHVLCMQGEIEASINLIRIKVKENDFITILPGSIFQIHKIEGELRIYFMGFSSEFLNYVNKAKIAIDLTYAIKERPVFSMKEKGAQLLEDYLKLLIRTYDFCGSKLNREITAHHFSGMLLAISAMYKDSSSSQTNLSKSEQICKKFGQLVMQNYNKERNVSWYAQKLTITHAHLCTTVKQVTGKTCIEIISEMVIMDAKTQLKSTNLSVQDIAYSLNFTNMSFFGKYFKRYIGMSPQEYRKN